MSIYKDMIRKHGVINRQQLINPRTFPLDELELPRDSIVHYLPMTTTDIGIEPRDPLLLNYDGNVLVSHVEVLGSTEGVPRVARGAFREQQRAYHKRYRAHRLIRKIDSALRDPRNLVVVNYALLQQTYRYTRNALTGYYQYYNLHNTVWEQIVKLVAITDRQHFIPMTIPQIIPEVSTLSKAVGKVKPMEMPRNLLQEFSDDATLNFLDLFLWLNNEDSTQGVTQFGGMPLDILKRINLLYVESGRWCVLPLEQLIQWIEDDVADLDTQLRRFYIKLMELRTVNNAELVEGEDETLRDETLPREAEAPQSTARTDVIVKQANELADVGALSGAEYRRVVREADKYKRIANPVGEGTLEDLTVIDPETVNTVPTGQIPDIDAVADKSMLQSSLQEFDSKYVEQVMPKDIANMVLGVQSAGIAVTDYKVERVVDAVNMYDSFTVKLTPVKGVPSTIRFKLPVVKEDGTFTANGVKARLNKQRGDVPIRKTGPGKVSLTSYYGKTFVSRSEKVVNNYGAWLVKNITAMGIDSNDTRISGINFANVFAKDVDVPRAYSAVAMNIREFKADGFTYHFDYHTRANAFGQDALDTVEQGDQLIVAKKGNQILTLDNGDILYLHNGESVQPLGEISSVLGIESNRVPVEICEMKIYGKQIPVGFVLAHELGLTTLINKLDVDIRRVPRGTRLDLSDDEYAVQFADESLIISRADKIASMILGGFNAYRNSIRNYNISDFDNRDVYFNALSDAGLTVRYIQEIELVFLMFIDHITKELLEMMNEPTNLVDLLIRAVELVVTDQHPEETDTRFMRIRGYERMSGMVYRQLVDSIREYRAKPVQAKASVDLNPKAVWLDVIQDQSLKLVEDSNPIHNLKEHEIVTFTGQGGRSAQTMVRSSRVFHPNDLGVISEATPDSGKVAISTYMTADAKLTNLRGMTDTFDKEVDGPAKLVSTSALVSPAADRDD